MLQWKLACIFFDIYDIFTVVQTCSYLNDTKEELYRAYLMERINLTDEYWLDLFHGQYGNHSMHHYDFKEVLQKFEKVLNHQLIPEKYSWKSFALLYNLNFEIYPTLPIKQNTTIESGSGIIGLKIPLRSLLNQHSKLIKRYTKEKASFSCFQAKIHHQYEDHILKIENITNIMKKIPNGIRGLQQNMKKRKQVFEKSLSVKRLCGNFTKKVSVIRSLQISLDRDTQVIDKKAKTLDRLKQHLHELDTQIHNFRQLKYAYIRSVHQDTINTNTFY